MSPDCLNCTNERFFESEALFNYHGVDNLAEANVAIAWQPGQNNSSAWRKLQTHFIFFVRATFQKQSLSDVLLPQALDRRQNAKSLFNLIPDMICNS